MRARIEALVRNPRVQHVLLRIPLLRGLVLRRSERLFDLLAGFTYSQVLAAFIRLDGPAALSGGPHTLSQLAARLSLEESAARRLLDAAAALDLVGRGADGRYALGPLGVPLLGRDDLRVLVEHHAVLYRDLEDPVALLRDDRRTPTALSGFWSYARGTDPAQVGSDAAAQYSAVMTATQPLVAAQVTSCYDFAAHRRLLDVGGGEGAFLAAVSVRAPALRLGLFELPAVAAAARARLQAAKVRDVEVFAGNLLTDALPAGFDCITLVRVCFDHDDEAVQALLRRVHAALAPGGRLVVAEPMAGLPHARGVEAYFTMYLTAMRSGRIRSEREFAALLRAAGFRSAEPLRASLPLQTGIVVGRR